MPIRVSSTRQIDALVTDLSSARAVAREAAVARLTVIGARAVERLIAAATDASAEIEPRTTAWRALEAIGDARMIDAAVRAFSAASTPPQVAAAAVAAVRPFIKGARGAAIVDSLTAIGLDRSRADTVRVAALRVLQELDGTTIAPLLASLARDTSAAVRDLASEPRTKRRAARPRHDGGESTVVEPAIVVIQAAEQGLPADPARLRAAIRHAGASVPLSTLLRIVERVREREGAETAPRRDEWRLARAAAHQALADRGSRVALYDVRESLESSKGALPVEFLAPLMSIGDASCLEAIAAAHASARDSWSRQHLAEAFYAIVAREKLTQRDAVMKRIAKKWKALSPRSRPADARRKQL